MRGTITITLRHGLLAFAALILAVSTARAAAQVTIINGNASGVGFHDPTPAVPVGGNPGTTVGQQALNAFQHAADVWGATLDSPVEIRVFSTFEPLTCTPTSAVLGSAGALFIFSDFGGVGAFPGPLLPNVWHHSALADKRAGEELNPDPFLGVAPAPDLRARFNSNLGQPTCLAGNGWYYGLDNHAPPNRIDLVTVVLHELAHGLGFSQFASVITGSRIGGLGDVYGASVLDTTTFKHWNDMTDFERKNSAINARRVVWDGATVHDAAPSVLQAGTPILSVHSPADIANIYAVGTASFGPPLATPGVTGQIVQALDSGPATTDACTPLTNAAAVTGRIAIVDRGTCTFTVKAQNVQAAGAIAMIVADNVAGAPPAGLGGADPTITIPSVRITLADAGVIKSKLSSVVTATLDLDLTLLSGADAQGRVYINAPNPVAPGSSISHWDPLTFRNQLMEPAINSDLTHSVTVPQDLTLALMRDVGWFPDADNDGFADDQDECDASNLSATLAIGGQNTGVTNILFNSGCTMADYIAAAAADAASHGGFVSAVADLANAWRDAGIVSGAQGGLIKSTSARSSLGK
jgi:hypothetical protein